MGEGEGEGEGVSVARDPRKRPAPAKEPVRVVLSPSERKVGRLPIAPPAPDLQKTLDQIREQHDPSASQQSKREWTKWLRRIAGLAFVHDDAERSVVYWHREQFGDLIKLDTFQTWAAADHWIQQREERLTKFREAVERQIGTDNVRAFVDDLRRLDGLYDDLADKLDGRGNVVTTVVTDEKGAAVTTTRVIVPVEFEKRSEAFGALVALDRRRDEKRKGVLGGLPSALGTGGGVNEREDASRATMTLSPNVARAMARAKMLAEREEVDGAGDSDDDDADGDA